MNVVKLDWDDIDIDVAKERQREIEKDLKVNTQLYRTKHGYHCTLLFDMKISITRNFQLREDYWDDKNRIKISKLRYQTIGHGHDILFDCKNGHWRQRI